MKGSVLLIEDHKDLAETIYMSLETAGYEVDYASDGNTGLHLATTTTVDVIILDIMLPGIDGFQVCEALRTVHGVDTPVLMLTARDTLDDKLTGFQHGADDYLVKPFETAELLARIAAIIKRQRGEMSKQVLRVADLSLHPDTITVVRGDKSISLSPTCFNILRILMRESPKVVSRSDLEHELWGDTIPDSDALRSHLYTLRKLVDKPFDQPLIKTLKGVGFKITAD